MSLSSPALQRFAVPLLLLATCLLGWALRAEAASHRTGPGHGDISSYVSVARSLADGRGFVEDVVSSYWVEPQTLPMPSNIWWMPLASLIAALGLLLGSGDYASAQAATAAFSALTPLAVFALARALHPACRKTALVAAALAACFHLFLGQPAVPLSVGPYAVFVPLALALAVFAAARPWLWLVCGAAVALAQLSRSDGVLLLAPALASAFLLGPREQRGAFVRRAALLLLLGYALTLSPWWLRNLQVFGTLQPGASARAAFMRQYDDWHKLPQDVTFDTLLADGWGPVLQERAQVAAHNLSNLGTGMVDAGLATDLAWDSPSVVALLVLAWLGALASLNRRGAGCWLAMALVLGLYSVLFTGVGPASFKQSLFGVYPFLLVGAAWCLTRVTDLAARLATPERRPQLGSVLLVLALAPILTGQARFGLHQARLKGESVGQLAAFWQAVDRFVLTPRGLVDELLLLRDVHEYNALLGRPALMLPNTDEEGLLDIAQRFGARHVLLTHQNTLQRRPGLQGLDNSPQFVRTFGPQPILGQLVTLYEIRP